MVCTQIMKRSLEVVRPEDNVHTAARKMRDRGVGFLPVVDGLGRPIGTVTDRDIAVRSAAEDHRPSNVSVREVMTTEPVTCSRFDDLRKAEELMAHHQKSRIMCVDEAGMLVGVISLSDIAESDRSERAVELLREVAHREARPPAVSP